MKHHVLTGIFILLGSVTFSQDSSHKSINQIREFNKTASIVVNGPIGAFDETHSIGFGAQFGWCPVLSNRSGSPKTRPVRLLLETRLDYFLGEKDQFNYRSKGYFVLQALAGMLFKPAHKSYYSLSAGIAVDRYGGHTDQGFTSSLSGSFFARKNYVVCTGLRFFKYRQAELLWVASIGVSYVF